MRVVIIEDEIAIMELLDILIREIDPGITIVGRSGDVGEAAEIIRSQTPDLVFTDIMLPGGTGFDIIQAVPEFGGEYIFVTAHDRFMLQALQHAAAGYVLKPVQKQELQHAIAQARKKLAKTQRPDMQALLSAIKEGSREVVEKIAIPSSTGFVFVQPEEILRCEGCKTYTWIYLFNGERLLSSYNLGEFRKLLPERYFFQVHKSHIISMKAVRLFHSRENLIELLDHSTVPLAKRSKAAFIQQFRIPHRL